MKYFKTDADKYIFALLELDGPSRTKVLGITKKMYSSKELADKWYMNILENIHDRSSSDGEAQKALVKLNTLYGEMIDH